MLVLLRQKTARTLLYPATAHHLWRLIRQAPTFSEWSAPTAAARGGSRRRSREAGRAKLFAWSGLPKVVWGKCKIPASLFPPGFSGVKMHPPNGRREGGERSENPALATGSRRMPRHGRGYQGPPRSAEPFGSCQGIR